MSAFFITVLSSIFIYFFANLAVGLFTDDELIISIAVTFLKLFAFVYPLISIGITTGRVLQGLGKGLPVLIITIVRVLGVSAPLAVFFIFYMGKPVEWVWYSMMVSTIVAFTIALTWLVSTIRTLPTVKLETNQ